LTIIQDESPFDHIVSHMFAYTTQKI